MAGKESLTIEYVGGSVRGRGARRPGPLPGWHVDYGQVRRPVPFRHYGHQHYGVVCDRRSDEPSDRAAAQPAPELAPVSGGGSFGRVYNLLLVRVRNNSTGAGWRPLAGGVVCGRQRGAGLRGSLAGRGASGAAIEEAAC